jgi:gliding motility-associated-like protein
MNSFIAKYDLQGNIIDARIFGNGSQIFKYAEMDNNGNIYLTRNDYNWTSSHLDKFSPDLDLIWTKLISSSSSSSTNGIFQTTGIKFNHENNRLYLWGKMNLVTNILGNVFNISNSNGIFQSALAEFDVSNGDLTFIKRYDNNSYYTIASSSAAPFDRSAYMLPKDGFLYFLTSFTGDMIFDNGTISSTKYHNEQYNSENLVLAKLNLTDYSSEYLFQSKGVENLNFLVTDLPGPMIFNNNDLYLTSTFGSNPILINDVVIQNNSGNNDSDALLYKYNLDSIQSNGIIRVENTCLGSMTSFFLNGNYDSIIWNFGDNTTSTDENPQHIYAASGMYLVSATVVCGENSQIVEKEIFIGLPPVLNPIDEIVECETAFGSGISSTFNTSEIITNLIGNQNGITLEFYDANGTLLPNPLPNPYTNISFGGDLITVHAYYNNNMYCLSTTTVNFTVISGVDIPVVDSNQNFCIHDNLNLNSITITGQDIKWYDSSTSNAILNNLTPLIDGGIYYATQTLGNCESERVPVFINIQNTPPAQGNNTQTFCSLSNPTINDLSVYGTNILWYSDLSSQTPLPLNTILTTDSYYYATQTVNGCESQQRLEIYVILNEGLNATDFEDFICSDSIISINISNYNVNFISNFINYSFEYYTSLIGANIQNENDKIINYSNFPLNFGRNTIFVRINSQNGCHQIVQLNINHYRNPIISINDIEVVCNNQPLTLNAGIGFDTYLWSTGSTNQNITITEPGFYSVSVTKNHNDIICSSSKNFEVVLSEIPVISEILTFDWNDNNNYIMAILSNLNSNNFLYSIDGINYQNSSNFYDLKNGLYTLYVKDIYDCGTVSKLFYLLMYPKYFTPNNDGYNDRWKIKFSELENDLIIEIFDRYGKLLNVMNSKESWNGTYNGIELPSSDYWFVVKRQNGVIHKGHFTLKR